MKTFLITLSLLSFLFSCRNEINTLEQETLKTIKVSASIESDQSFNYEFECSDPQMMDSSEIGNIVSSNSKMNYSPTDIGLDSFSYKCNDKYYLFDIKVKDYLAPVSENTILYVLEDEDLDFSISYTSERDTTFSLDQSPSHGSLTGFFPNFNYEPNADFNGTDSIIFTLDNGKVSSYTITFNVSNVNDSPVVSLMNLTTNEDTTLNFNLSGSDIDSSISYTITNTTSNGSLSCSNESCVYNPNLNFNGVDTFQYNVSDGEITVTNNVNINVIAVNDSPIANDLVFNIDEDTTLNFNLDAQDDGALTYSYTSVSNGTLSCTDDSCSYTPSLNFNGTDSFQYTVSDGSSSDSATVTINVRPINDRPLAQDDSYSVNMNENLNIVLYGSDPEGDSLTYIASSPLNGSIICSGNSCQYTADPDYYGSDSFDYYTNDGSLSSEVKTININVLYVNQAPVALSSTFSLLEDNVYNFNLPASDTENDPLTYSIETSTSNGTLSCTDGSCSYTPNLNFNGSDSFTYKVNDGSQDSSTETITLQVSPVNDAPLSQDQTLIAAYQDSTVENFNVSDVDGDSLSIEIVSNPSQGTVVVSGTSFTYTHQTTVLTDSFTYRSYDGNLYSETKTVSIGTPPPSHARDNTFRITINSSYVKNVDNFPYYYNLKNMPLNFWNNVQSNGGDIVVVDENDTRLPVEIINLNTANQTGTIWFKSNPSSFFEIKYNNSATADISVTPRSDTYGAYNVWSEYVAVWHLDDFSNVTDALDLSHLTKGGDSSFNNLSSSSLENSIEVNSDYGNDDLFYMNHDNRFSLTELTIEAWVNPSNEDNDLRVLQKRNGTNYSDYGLFIDYGYASFRLNNSTQVQSSIKVNQNQWNYVVTTYDGSDANIFLNGQLDSTHNLNLALNDSQDLLELAGVKDRNERGFKGLLDEVRISNKTFSSDWTSLNYDMITKNDFWQKNNQSEEINTDFSIANSNDLPSPWSETETTSGQISINNGMIDIDGDNENNLPLSSYPLSQSYTSGILNISFDFLGNRHGSEMYYELVIQAVDNNNAMNSGIGANLKWGSAYEGMTTNTGFGYEEVGSVTEMFSVNNEWVNVNVIIDIDNKKYKIITNKGDSSWIDFYDTSITDISFFRFYANGVHGGNVDLSIDNLSINHYNL